MSKKLSSLIILGASGDLTSRLLLPGLGQLLGEQNERHLQLIGVGGADAGTYARHGYAEAMQTQIDHGIFDYCGARVLTSELMLESETQDPAIHLDAAHALGRELAAASRGLDPTSAVLPASQHDARL